MIHSIPSYNNNRSNSENTSNKTHDTNNEDLSARCRRLASSLGDSAIHEHQFDHSINPITLNTSSSPTRRSTLNSINTLQGQGNGNNNNNNRIHSPNSNSNSNNLLLSPRSTTPDSGSCGSIGSNSNLEGINEDPNESKYTDELTSTSTKIQNQNQQSESLFKPGYSLGLGLTNTGSINSSTLIEDSEESEENETPTSSNVHLGLPLSKEVEQANLIEAALRRNPNPSIDVKCWLVDGELLYANEQASLSPTNTVYNGYIRPLHKLLTAGGSEKGHHRRRSSTFSQITPVSPLKLIFTLQNSPIISFQYLLNEIKSLHDDSLLVTFCERSNLTFSGLVKVFVDTKSSSTDTGSDNEDQDQVSKELREEIEKLSPRYVFDLETEESKIES